MFLHYILNQDSDSILHRFLMAQIENRSKKDWIVQVLTDINELKMNDDLNKIKQVKKSKFRNMLDRKIKQNAFEDLIIKQESHSKVKGLKY